MSEPPATGDCVSPLAAVAEVLSECRLLSYMSQMSMRMSFLFRLINIIHVQTLTQVKSCQGPCSCLTGTGVVSGAGGREEPGFLGGHPCPFFLAVCRNTSTVCFPRACFIGMCVQQVSWYLWFFAVSFLLPGKCQLFEHKFSYPNAGPKERKTPFLPAHLATDGIHRKIPWLHPEQLPQPPAILAAALPQQG